MRDAFFEALTEAAAADERIWALTGDLGIGLFDAFEQVAPGRYLNVGIAEQAMVGIAAGLAYVGKRPVAYSIAPFVTSRPQEQVRVDVAMAQANVVLAGVGGGMAYGYLGPTHHATEDLAVMRALPGMTVLAPGDPGETKRATRAALDLGGPVYLRLGKNGEPDLLPARPFQIGKAVTVKPGDDVTLISTGSILAETLGAARRLTERGISAHVLHCPSVKPFDTHEVCAAGAHTGLVITIEEHNVIGGLGSATAEALSEYGIGARLVRLGLQDEFAHTVGSREFLLRHHGLDAQAIAARAESLLGEAPRHAAAA
jgi:transketolase